VQTRPLLLLDIDGPLNPYRAKEIPPGYELHEIQEGDKKWTLLLNQQHGTELNALAEIFDLVWATSWEHGANRLIAPRLGLPDNLPVIIWPADARETARPGLSWKTAHVSDWVGDRPFAWLDDEVGLADRDFLLAYDELRPGGAGSPTRQGDVRSRTFFLHPVAPEHGLLQRDFELIREWGNLKRG
jgi:hypothetical protein